MKSPFYLGASFCVASWWGYNESMWHKIKQHRRELIGWMAIVIFFSLSYAQIGKGTLEARTERAFERNTVTTVLVLGWLWINRKNDLG